MLLFLALFIAVALAGTCSAHMSLDYPAAFNASNNPHRKTAPDPYLEYPYNCCGPGSRWSYPCRGYEKLLGTPEGAPTASWQAGSTATFILSGSGNHFGGSCQVGFSTDGARQFHVANSYEGNCPHRNNGTAPDGQHFEFNVPADLQPGVQIFAWIWYNRERELNMNCAAVRITAASPGDQAPSSYGSAFNVPSKSDSSMDPIASSEDTLNGCIREGGIDPQDGNAPRHSPPPNGSPNPVAFRDRPLMFVADDGNDCHTPHTTAELKYPDPGPDVTPGDGVYPVELPSGSCGQQQMLAKQAFVG